MSNKDEQITEELCHKLDGRMLELKTFIARRFDEISMEINATSQMIDMNEEALGNRFAEVLKVLNAVGHYSQGKSGSNSGYELDKVVHETEKATNDIIDAADRINSRINKDVDNWNDQDLRESLLTEISRDIEAIMLACSFQDLTGQRIRKAVSNIRQAEDRLKNVMEDIGLHVNDVEELSTELITPNIASQEDIDTLFAEARKSGKL